MNNIRVCFCVIVCGACLVWCMHARGACMPVVHASMVCDAVVGIVCT